LRIDPRVYDAVVALGLVAFTLLTINPDKLQHGQHANNALAYVLAIGWSAPYVVHRRYPLSALTVALVAVAIHVAAAFPAYPAAVFVLLFGISLHSDRRRSAVAFAAIFVVMTAAITLEPDGIVDQGTWIATELCIIVAWLGGDNLRTRRTRWAELQERNQLLEQGEEQRARKAVLDERLRIARELHDVVAHAMSVIAVQSGVANHVIDSRPDEARRALGAIETTSRTALVEMRRMLQLLREEGETEADRQPAPGLRDVDTLVRRVADGGLAAAVHINGAPVDVPPGVDMSAYRIVQEALTNVIKHGGSAADITLTYTDRDVRIEVSNDDRPGAGRGQRVITPGHGLVGMRERVAVLGGDFSAAPRPGGGFRVAARLPYAVSES
jgi:signal transduction histidine kinase